MEEDTTSAPLLVTFREAANLLGTSESKVRSLVRRRQLAAVRVGKRLMIPRHAIPGFVTANIIHPVLQARR